MELALMTEPQIGATYDDQLAAARYAEQRGLAAFARADHYLSSREGANATDAFAVLAGLARETTDVGLVLLVSPITFRHPGVILKTAATIDEMSGGRLSLGIGTGWMELEHDAFGFPFWEWPERFARFEESLRYVRAALDGEEFAGEHYRLSSTDVHPRRTGRLPIIVGGSGPRRTPRLAGAYADEYNVFVSSPEALGERLPHLRDAAMAAGRDPDAILVSMMGPVLIGPDEATYRERLAAAAATRDGTPEELEARYAELGIPHGPADRARATMAALESAGVQRFYVQHLDLDPLDTELLDETFGILSQ